MYTSIDGVSEHRIETSRKMSTIKAYDIDLHATVVSFIALIGYSLYITVRLLQ